MPAVVALSPFVAPSQALAAGSYVGVGAGVIGLHLTEQSQGDTEVEESGLLPATELKLGIQVTDRFYLRTSLATSAGEVDYSGETQFGRPLSTHTDYALQRYEVVAGRVFGRSRLFVGLAYDLNDRVIRRVPGVLENEYSEDQTRIDTIFGLATTMAEANGRHLAFEASIGASVQSELEVTFANGFDPVTISLERTYLAKARLTWTRDLGGNWSLAVSPEVFYSQMEESAKVLLYSNGESTGLLVGQQDTEQQGFNLNISLYWHF